MKKLITLVTLTLAFKVNAQEQVNYKVVEDSPKNITNFSCNFDLMHFDCGFNNIDATSFNLGVWGHAMFKERFGLDYSFRYAWLTFVKSVEKDKDLASNANFQLGGFFIFANKQKIKQNRIILKASSGGYTRDGRSITNITYLNVPSGKWNYVALRSGLYFKRSPLTIRDVATTYTNYFNLGVYAGICFGSSVKVKIQTDNFGARGSARHTRFCLDALITPINNVPTNAEVKLPIGARVVWQSLPVVQGKKNRKLFRQGITTEVEFGYRIVDGPYVAATLAIPLTRTFSALSKDGNNGTKARTSE